MEEKNQQTSINGLGFSRTTIRGLNYAKIQFLEEITKFYKEELAKFRWVGPKGIEEIETTLKSKGLSFLQPKRRKPYDGHYGSQGDQGSSNFPFDD